jgi:AraC family transcriptional regulator of adaptative response / methylphosphotriester-DNA alkyltransferase methyltransferase
MIIFDILEYIQQNFTSNLIAKEVATKFGLCRYKFSRLFNQETGTNFDLHIQKLRLNRARELLDSGTSIKQTCFESGFQSEAQFFRVFKKNLGMTPKQYHNAQTIDKKDIEKDLDRLLEEYIENRNDF